MAGTTSEQPVGVRGLARMSVRDHVKDQAVRLFDERGFDATTIDDIAQAVGMSSRTFFRYFASKEDVVIEDPEPLGTIVRDAAEGRPDTETAWETLRRALDPVAEKASASTESWVRSMRVMMSNTSLRARNVEKHNAWALMLEPVIAKRLNGPKDTKRYRAQSLIQAALACLDISLVEWTRQGGQVTFVVLLDQAFSAVTESAIRPSEN